jgi:hypothetical protein
MTKGISVLAVVVCVAASTPANAQQVTNLPKGTDQVAGVEAGLDSAFIARASYAHQLGFLRDAMVYARITWPFVKPDLADLAVDAGLTATVVGSEQWKVQALLGPVVRSTANSVFSGTALGIRSGILAGYRSDSWGLLADLEYEQMLAAHLTQSAKYKAYYPDAKDGWYSITGGTFQAGLRGGGRIGRVELFGTLGAMMTDRLKSGTPPLYATIGSTYAF